MISIYSVTTSTQVRPPPRSLSQALQAAQPLATLTPAHPPKPPPHAEYMALLTSDNQAQPAGEQPKPQQQPALLQEAEQQQQQQPALLQEAQQHQHQRRPASSTNSEHQQLLQLTCNSEPELQLTCNSGSGRAAVSQSARQQDPEIHATAQQETGSEPGTGMSLEASPKPEHGMPFSPRSHVSPSPTSCRTGRSENVEEAAKQRSGQAFTLDDSAAQSEHPSQRERSMGQWSQQSGSPGPSDCAHPVLTEALLPSQRQSVAMGISSAHKREMGSAEHTSADPAVAALEPAGPSQSALSGQDAVPGPSSLDAQPQKHPPDDLSKNQSKARPWHVTRGAPQPLPKQRSQQQQEHNVTFEGPKLPSQLGVAGRLSEQKSRHASQEASAAPAESQQSAVHIAPTASRRAVHVKKSANLRKDILPATAALAADGHTASSKAKRARAETMIGALKAKQREEPTQKRACPCLSTMSHASHAKHSARPAVQAAADNDSCGIVLRLDRVRKTAEHISDEAEAQRGIPAETGSGKAREESSRSRRKTDSISESFDKSRAAKRSLRTRDSDASKPWWVV